MGVGSLEEVAVGGLDRAFRVPCPEVGFRLRDPVGRERVAHGI